MIISNTSSTVFPNVPMKNGRRIVDIVESRVKIRVVIYAIVSMHIYRVLKKWISRFEIPILKGVWH
jgi:hypothetical protein